jgi:hypothetical protein
VPKKEREMEIAKEGFVIMAKTFMNEYIFSEKVLKGDFCDDLKVERIS